MFTTFISFWVDLFRSLIFTISDIFNSQTNKLRTDIEKTVDDLLSYEKLFNLKLPLYLKNMIDKSKENIFINLDSDEEVHKWESFILSSEQFINTFRDVYFMVNFSLLLTGIEESELKTFEYVLDGIMEKYTESSFTRVNKEFKQFFEMVIIPVLDISSVKKFTLKRFINETTIFSKNNNINNITNLIMEKI